jgi:hypothetical protein
MKIFNIFKRKKEPKIINGAIPENHIMCNTCGKIFEIIPSKIYRTQIRALYQDYFFPGKGYLCPYCQKECIIN